VKCPNPACGAEVPLVRQTWLCKKAKKCVALKVIPNYETMRVDFEVVEATTEEDLGFDPASGSSRGTSICRHCGATAKTKPYIQAEGKAGRIGQQLMAIVCTTPGEQGKTYLSATDYQQYIPDEKAILERLEKLCNETSLTVPDEPIFSGDTRAFFTHLYGLDNFGKLFSPRQLLSLMTFVKWVRKAHDELLAQGYEEEFAKAISTYLTLGITKVANRGSNVGVYHSGRETIESPISNGRLPMSWDFPETNPVGAGSGNYIDGLQWTIETVEKLSEIIQFAIINRQSSQAINIENSSLDAVITDPPYFDAVPYADLSDYFYVWFKRSIGHLYPEHFSAKLTPKKQEATMEPSRHGGDKQKAAQAYEDMMHQAFCEANRVLKNDGLMCVVYAHKTTMGWSTLIDSLRRAGFVITEAWPLDTEQQGGLRGLKASLASSIFLISRKRTSSPQPPSPQGEGGAKFSSPVGEGLGVRVGDYAMDVQPQLREIIQSRVKSLMEEGVSGADLVIACVGAGLRAYTQFDSVELPNGEELDATTFLSEVQKEVAETILQEVLNCDSKGVSQIDKATQYYILARYEYGEAEVAFDEANTLAKGVGIELDGPGGLTDSKWALVAKTKNTVKLRNYGDRGKDDSLGIIPTDTIQEFNKPSPRPSPTGRGSYQPSLIDILHRLLWLAEHKPSDIGDYLARAQPDGSQLRLVAQALSGRALTPTPGEEMTAQRSPEQQAIDTLLASWKRTIEDNLFTQRKLP
jgi:putative DNA methylase